MKPAAIYSKFALALFAGALLLGVSQSVNAATIVIQNADSAGVGFNDPTPVAPVGNNTGTTLGQQRLNAFQFAANLWGATLNSGVTITISASWKSLDCSKGILGQASTNSVFRNFPNAPKPNTWFSGAEANALSNTDLDPSNADIDAEFNINVGSPTCLNGTPFYLGLDNNYGTAIDLVTVLLHEFGHGLGFLTFTDETNGVQCCSGSVFPSIYDYFLLDNTTHKTWNAMTNAERQASAINNGNLVWTGSQTVSEVPNALGTTRLRVNAPSAIAGTYDAGGEAFTGDLRSRPLAFSTNATTTQVSGAVAAVTPADACTAITNGGAIAGKVALIDRGTCNFIVKVKNAQNAGAIGAIIANVTGSNQNVGPMGGTDSTVSIPAVLISQTDGTTLKGQLGAGLNAALVIDSSAPVGVDAQNHPRIYAPAMIDSGSSVSHWDVVEYPDLLMEPGINPDIIHSVAVPVDLTLAQLRDIGWKANPIGDSAFFVRQQYLDFLNRQPDSSGFAFWTNNIFNCGIDQQCTEVHRINASAAFFLSIEFQDTGNLVYKMYKAGFGNVPGTPVGVRRANFQQDSQTIQNSPNQIIVGQGNWQANLEANKQAFALSFVQRAGFPNQSDPAAFVDNLFANAGVTPTSTERAAAINAFNGAGGGNSGRAAALRSVCDSGSVTFALRNEAFVLMQYFGYLQRDPDAQTPADYSGFQFWLNKLNSFNGDFIGAEMVKAFLNSTEYRARFGNS